MAFKKDTGGWGGGGVTTTSRSNATTKRSNVKTLNSSPPPEDWSNIWRNANSGGDKAPAPAPTVTWTPPPIPIQPTADYGGGNKLASPAPIPPVPAPSFPSNMDAVNAARAAQAESLLSGSVPYRNPLYESGNGGYVKDSEYPSIPLSVVAKHLYDPNQDWRDAIKQMMNNVNYTDPNDPMYLQPYSYIDDRILMDDKAKNSLNEGVASRYAGSVLGPDYYNVWNSLPEGQVNPAVQVVPGVDPFAYLDSKQFGLNRPFSVRGGLGLGNPIEVDPNALPIQLDYKFLPGGSVDGLQTVAGEPLLDAERGYETTPEYWAHLNGNRGKEGFIERALTDLVGASNVSPAVMKAAIIDQKQMDGELVDGVSSVDLTDPETLGYYYDIFKPDENAGGGGYGGGSGGYGSSYGGGGGGGGYGYTQQAQVTPTWSTYDAGVTDGPSWWQPLMPSELTPQSEYQTYLNAMIPFLSPEDQQTVSSLLYQMDPATFAHLDPAITGAPDIPPEMTPDLIKKFTDQMRSNQALTSLQNMLAAMGVSVNDAGEGYRFLTNALNYLTQYGATNTEGQTRMQRLELMNAANTLSSNASKEASPYSNLIKMLVNPYFSTGKVAPVYKDQAGDYIFGEAQKELF